MNIFVVYEYFSRVDNVVKKGNTVFATRSLPSTIFDIRSLEKEIANMYGHKPHEVVIIDYKAM